MRDIKPCPKCHGDVTMFSVGKFTGTYDLGYRLCCACNFAFSQTRFTEDKNELIDKWNDKVEMLEKGDKL